MKGIKMPKKTTSKKDIKFAVECASEEIDEIKAHVITLIKNHPEDFKDEDGYIDYYAVISYTVEMAKECYEMAKVNNQ